MNGGTSKISILDILLLLVNNLSLKCTFIPSKNISKSIRKTLIHASWILNQNHSFYYSVYGLVWLFECKVLRSQQGVLKHNITLILPDASTPSPNSTTRWRSPLATKNKNSLPCACCQVQKNISVYWWTLLEAPGGPGQYPEQPRR